MKMVLNICESRILQELYVFMEAIDMLVSSIVSQTYRVVFQLLIKPLFCTIEL